MIRKNNEVGIRWTVFVYLFILILICLYSMYHALSV